jgi:dihydrofolate reductase
MVNIIVAVADNWAIGKDNQLLWHISEDLKFFKRTTLGCSVVMGRRTFESIGRPLPKRTNIVVSRGFDAPEGVLVASSLEQALELAGGGSCESDVFVIGGGQIYAQSIDLAQKLYITHVHTVIEDADAFFPAIDPQVWQVESRSELYNDEESGYDYEFVVYSRK